MSSACKDSESVKLPFAGLICEDSDAMLLWEGEVDFSKPKLSKDKIGKMMTKLGKLFTNLEQFATPNNQAGWNERLKSCEADLHVSTLWRAPSLAGHIGSSLARIISELF